VEWGQGAGYENIPGFRSVAIGGLSSFGLMAQDSLRQPFETIEQRPQFSILLRGSAKPGHYFGSELHIDGFAFGLIRPLEVRSMAFSGVVAASALSFAALHHPLEKRPFAEVFQLLKFPL
jgi:hypothetical protein